MYCKKCGAAVVGRYCSYCGTRVRTDLDEYKSLLRRVKGEYIRECNYYRTADRRGLAVTHLAEACWTAAEIRYGSEYCVADFILTSEDLDNVEAVKEHALLLFRQLIAF